MSGFLPMVSKSVVKVSDLHLPVPEKKHIAVFSSDSNGVESWAKYLQQLFQIDLQAFSLCVFSFVLMISDPILSW